MYIEYCSVIDTRGPNTIPTIQVRSKAVLFYEQYLNVSNVKKSMSLKQQAALEESKKYSGSITSGAKKRISKAVDLMIQCSPYKMVWNDIINKYTKFSLNFITLTIPTNNRMVTAKEGNKSLLQPFLHWLRVKHGVDMYVWKAELQKRGQLHYHITTNTFIRHEEIKRVWNELLQREKLMDEYFEAHGHYNANSTDVHAVYKVRDIKAYLVKYLSKNDDKGGQTEGKIWGCSKKLSKAGYYRDMRCSENEVRAEISMKKGMAEEIRMEQCIMYQVKGVEAKYMLTEMQRNEYEKFIIRLKSNEWDKSEEESMLVIKAEDCRLARVEVESGRLKSKSWQQVGIGMMSSS